MAQFARPDADVTNTGTNGFAAIDESSASDADFWWGDNNVAEELEVSLSNVTDPASSTGHVVRYRIAKVNAGTLDGGGNAVTITTRLMQGGTQIATSGAIGTTGSWAAQTFTLSGAQADAITDYTDLRLEFVTSASGGSPANRRGGAVSWAELEVPDASVTLTPASLTHTRGIGVAYADTVAADAPYFYWRLDETSGTNADDATTNNRDGTYTNSPTLNQDSLLDSYPAGRSVSFGSGSDYVASTFLLNTAIVTVEAWVLIDAFPSAGNKAVVVGFSEGFGGSAHDKNLYIDENGKPGFYVFDGGAKSTSVPDNALSIGTAYHLVGTCDGTTARCYVNGVEVGSVAAGNSYTGYSVNNIFAPSAPTGWVKFQGHLDEVAVYTSALSEGRILAHYEAGATGAAGIEVIVSEGVRPTGLVHTRALGSPAVSPQLRLTGLARTRAQGSPSIAVASTLFPAGLAHTRTQGSPAASPTLVLTGLEHTRAQGATGTDTTLVPAALERTRALGSPQTNPTLVPVGIAHTRALGATSILSLDSLLPVSLERTRAQGGPTVSPTASPAALAHTRAQGSPLVSPTLSPAGLVHTRATSSPTIALGLSPASLTHTRAQGAPQLNVSLLLTGLVHTRDLGAGTRIAPPAGVRAGHTHSIHGRYHRDGDTD